MDEKPLDLRVGNSGFPSEKCTLAKADTLNSLPLPLSSQPPGLLRTRSFKDDFYTQPFKCCHMLPISEVSQNAVANSSSYSCSGLSDFGRKASPDLYTKPPKFGHMLPVSEASQNAVFDKRCQPFKEFDRHSPLKEIIATFGSRAADLILRYAHFKELMQDMINENTKQQSHKNMNRRKSSPGGEEEDTERSSYRVKNNISARKSRMNRKEKFEELTLTVAFLEKEIHLLLKENESLKNEFSKNEFLKNEFLNKASAHSQ